MRLCSRRQRACRGAGRMISAPTGPTRIWRLRRRWYRPAACGLGSRSTAGKRRKMSWRRRPSPISRSGRCGRRSCPLPAARLPWREPWNGRRSPTECGCGSLPAPSSSGGCILPSADSGMMCCTATPFTTGAGGWSCIADWWWRTVSQDLISRSSRNMQRTLLPWVRSTRRRSGDSSRRRGLSCAARQRHRPGSWARRPETT